MSTTEYTFGSANESFCTTPAVTSNLQCALLACPDLFDTLESPEKWKVVLKGVLEELPSSITGFPFRSWLNFDSLGLPEMKHSEPSPFLKYKERYGESIAAFWRGYQEALTKYMNANPDKLDPAALKGFVGFKAVFYTTDPTHHHVLRAWVLKCGMPAEVDSSPSQMDDQVAIPIETTLNLIGDWEYGSAALEKAQAMIHVLNFKTHSPDQLKPANQQHDK